VQEVALSVEPGERRAIIGPNGAGKTTLFHMIAGELRPSTGRIGLFGRDVTRLPPHRRAALGLGRTFQTNTLFPTLTVMENLLLAVHGVEPTKLRLHRPIGSYRELADLDPAMSLLVIEHDMEVVFGVTERVTVLHYGRVVADGSRDEVKANPLVAEIYLGTG
jgi:branched-chain amino acid transport system ATP-binding protein